MSVRAQPTQGLGLTLPRNSQGADAIQVLDSHLPDVARAYGLTPQQLVTLLRQQPSLGVDRSGALAFLCEGLVVRADANTTATSSTSTTTATAEDALHLHSLPGAMRVIYLDFDGHTTSGTNWNTSYTGGAPIVSQPFDLDGDPTTFSATELGLIRGVWQRVAEDYAAFGVDVTTEDPGVEALRRIDANDLAYGVRVVISPTNWYSTNAGGVAYIGSFRWNTDTPCFAFSTQLANGEKYIAEAVAHEAGHTLGLHHDGLGGAAPTEYYQGQGNWAPIMGVGYYKAVAQWSRGEYANANNLEDDLAVIPVNGAPLLADDHGDTLATASVLKVTDASVSDGGTIETRADVDVFRFDTGAGAISFNISGPSPSPNLDIKAELLDATGQVLQTSDTSALSANLSLNVPAGTYYLRIDGVGSGDPVTTGYSDYASIGNYVILGTVVPTGAKQAPTAVLSATPTTGSAPLTVAFNGQNSSDADGYLVSYRWDFGTGASSNEINPSYTYAATGSFPVSLTVTDNDGLVGTATTAITVTLPPNQLPQAVVSATPTSGAAPLPVAFSSAGSSDPDGTITAYRWDFGDGTFSSEASPSKTYNTAGNYTARLTVTDDRGGASSATMAISVSADTSLDVDVKQFTLTTATAQSGTTANATILVRDRLARPASGVAVTISWSGVVTGTSTGTTDGSGQVVLASPRTKKKGTVTATITGVTPTGGAKFDDTIYAAPSALSVPVN